MCAKQHVFRDVEQHKRLRIVLLPSDSPAMAAGRSPGELHMTNAHLSPAEQKVAARLADILLWAGDDRAADAVHALIEASMPTLVTITTSGNVTTLHFPA